MKQTWQHLEDCQHCSCNKNRKCDGYRVMVDKGYEFNPYKCEFMIGKRKNQGYCLNFVKLLLL